MGSLPATVTPVLGKLIPRLATEHDGEVVATARAIGRTLQAAGVDWHALAAAIAYSPGPKLIDSGSDRPSSDDPNGIDPADWHAMAKWAR